MDPLKRQTATATPAEPGGLFDFASLGRARQTPAGMSADGLFVFTHRNSATPGRNAAARCSIAA